MGTCSRCRRQTIGEFKTCQKCKENKKAYQAQRRARHRAAGTCLACGRPTAENRKSCVACSTRATNSTMSRYHVNKANGVCPQCGAETNGRFRCDICHQSHLLAGTIDWHTKRAIVIDHYGGHCKCCGETTHQFLEIDHINSDGREHRISTGRHVMEWIIKNNFPDNLQVLCANCNRGKGKFGVCPHHRVPTVPASKAGQRSRERRLRCINQYGGKCIKCGESNWAFLEFDHTNDDGSAHRKQLGKRPIVQWIINNEFPATIQLLCSNCNMSKRMNTKTGPVVAPTAP